MFATPSLTPRRFVPARRRGGGTAADILPNNKFGEKHYSTHLQGNFDDFYIPFDSEDIDQNQCRWVMDYLELTPELLLTKIESIHSRVHNLFYTDVGRYCQHIDSCIAQAIMQTFLNQQKFILPVHDSFIVIEEDNDLLVRVIKEKYTEVMQYITGSTFTVDVKEIELSEDNQSQRAERPSMIDTTIMTSDKPNIKRDMESVMAEIINDACAPNILDDLDYNAIIIDENGRIVDTKREINSNFPNNQQSEFDWDNIL